MLVVDFQQEYILFSFKDVFVYSGWFEIQSNIHFSLCIETNITLATLWANNVVAISRDCFKVIVVVGTKVKVRIIVVHKTTDIRMRSSKSVAENHKCLTALHST
jgi:hypothetical protein